MTPTCPVCGDPVVIDLPQTLACSPCYWAALLGVTKADVLAAQGVSRQGVVAYTTATALEAAGVTVQRPVRLGVLNT